MYFLVNSAHKFAASKPPIFDQETTAVLVLVSGSRAQVFVSLSERFRYLGSAPQTPEEAVGHRLHFKSYWVFD